MTKSWKKLKSSEVVGLSLSELLMLTTFLLLVVMMIFYRKYCDLREFNADVLGFTSMISEIDKSAGKVDKMMFQDQAEPQGAEGVGEQLESIKNLVEKLREETDREAAREVLKEHSLPEVWEELVSVREELAGVKRELETIMKSGKDLQNLAEELSRIVRRNDELEKRNAVLETRIAEYERMVARTDAESFEELVSRFETIQGQMKNLQKRAGLDAPPCWVDSEGGLQYTFKVTILDNKLKVERIWPQSRTDEIRKLGLPVEGYPLYMEHSEFRNRMRGFYDKGRRQGCRYFVELDENVNTKSALKQGQRLVEGYFYVRRVY